MLGVRDGLLTLDNYSFDVVSGTIDFYVLPRILVSQLFAIYDCLFFFFFLYHSYFVYDVIINKLIN